eukprot:PhM_4_TR15539/c0_g1_i1/m.35795
MWRLNTISARFPNQHRGTVFRLPHHVCGAVTTQKRCYCNDALFRDEMKSCASATGWLQSSASFPLTTSNRNALNELCACSPSEQSSDDLVALLHAMADAEVPLEKEVHTKLSAWALSGGAGLSAKLSLLEALLRVRHSADAEAAAVGTVQAMATSSHHVAPRDVAVMFRAAACCTSAASEKELHAIQPALFTLAVQHCDELTPEHVADVASGYVVFGVTHELLHRLVRRAVSISGQMTADDTARCLRAFTSCSVRLPELEPLMKCMDTATGVNGGWASLNSTCTYEILSIAPRLKLERLRLEQLQPALLRHLGRNNKTLDLFRAWCRSGTTHIPDGLVDGVVSAIVSAKTGTDLLQASTITSIVTAANGFVLHITDEAVSEQFCDAITKDVLPQLKGTPMISSLASSLASFRVPETAAAVALTMFFANYLLANRANIVQPWDLTNLLRCIILTVGISSSGSSSTTEKRREVLEKVSPSIIVLAPTFPQREFIALCEVLTSWPGDGPPKEIVAAMSKRGTSVSSQLTLPDLGKMLVAFSGLKTKEGGNNTNLFLSCSTRAKAATTPCSVRDVSNIIGSFASVRVWNSVVFSKVAERGLPSKGQAMAQDIVNVISAFASVDLGAERVARQYRSYAITISDSLSSDQLMTLLSCLGKVRSPIAGAAGHAAELRGLLEKVAPQCATFPESQVAHLLQLCMSCDQDAPSVLDPLIERVSEAGVDKLDVGALRGVILGVALRLTASSPSSEASMGTATTLMQTATSTFLRHLDEATMRVLLDVLTAHQQLTRVQTVESKCTIRLLVEALPRATALCATSGPEDLAALAQIYSKASFWHIGLYNAIVERARGIRAEFRPNELAQLLEAFLAVGYIPAAFVSDVSAKIGVVLNACSAAQLVTYSRMLDLARIDAGETLRVLFQRRYAVLQQLEMENPTQDGKHHLALAQKHLRNLGIDVLNETVAETSGERT